MQDKQISLHFGLDNENHVQSSKIKFQVDFHFSYILLQNDIICDQNNSCTIESDQIYGPSFYQFKSYQYTHIKTFLGLTQQITRTFNEKDKYAYFNVPFRKLTPECEIKQNIVGLSMKSAIWEHWVDLYNFKNDVIHFDIVLENKNKKIVFWNLYLPPKNGWIISLKKYQFTQWNMKLQVKNQNTILSESFPIFSFDQEQELLFTTNLGIYKLLISYICKQDTKCEQISDLQEDLDSFSFVIFVQDNLQIIYKLKELFVVENDGQLKFLFGLNSRRFENIDIVLQNLFFQKYFITIQNDLNNQENFYVKIQDLSVLHNAFRNSFVLFTIYFFVIVLIVVFCYIIYSKFFVKRRVLEEQKSNFESQLYF